MKKILSSSSRNSVKEASLKMQAVLGFVAGLKIICGETIRVNLSKGIIVQFREKSITYSTSSWHYPIMAPLESGHSINQAALPTATELH